MTQQNAALPDGGGFIQVCKYLPAGNPVVVEIGDEKHPGTLTGRIDQYSRHEIKTANATHWVSWDRYDLSEQET